MNSTRFLAACSGAVIALSSSVPLASAWFRDDYQLLKNLDQSSGWSLSGSPVLAEWPSWIGIPGEMAPYEKASFAPVLQIRTGFGREFLENTTGMTEEWPSWIGRIR
ncbi:MAG: hypothetical protein V1926_01285 [Candidatus Peregrinibacteria bacterium]